MKKWIKLILIIICMGVIFSFSSDNAVDSTKKSDGLIIRVSSILSKDKLTKEEQVAVINKFVKPVRKSAHFLIYMVLGILLISFLGEFSITRRKMILLAIFLAFLYACSDEVHQLFVTGRSGQFSDVILDTMGSVTGIYLYILLIKLFKKKEVTYE